MSKLVDRSVFDEDITTHDGFVNAVLFGVPESWDGDDAAESIALEYVGEIERRLVARGGSLERWDETDEQR